MACILTSIFIYAGIAGLIAVRWFLPPGHVGASSHWIDHPVVPLRLLYRALVFLGMYFLSFFLTTMLFGLALRYLAGFGEAFVQLPMPLRQISLFILAILPAIGAANIVAWRARRIPARPRIHIGR